MFQWENFDKLITQYNYIIVGRDNIDLKRILEKNELILKNRAKINFLNMKEKYQNISSTKIREMFESKKIEEVKKYIPKEIYNYIIENKIWN